MYKNPLSSILSLLIKCLYRLQILFQSFLNLIPIHCPEGLQPVFRHLLSLILTKTGVKKWLGSPFRQNFYLSDIFRQQKTRLPTFFKALFSSQLTNTTCKAQ
jgi:hypothetical protein